MGGPGGLLIPWSFDVVVEDILVLAVAVVAKMAKCRVCRLTHHRPNRQPFNFVCMGICVLCSRYFKTVCIKCVSIHIVTACKGPCSRPTPVMPSAQGESQAEPRPCIALFLKV